MTPGRPYALAVAALIVSSILPRVLCAEVRMAVVVGSDRGAAGRPRLWFAEKDAVRVSETLTELGGFARGRVRLLRGESLAAMRGAIADMQRELELARQAGESTLALVYYSGHADTHGLELGNEALPFGELRALVSALPADAKIAIVDACEAGLLTQVKGAVLAPGLDFAITPDEGARGVAFVASTAVGETAQESAALGGSFFTHHLEAALRGAADVDDDGRVTLTEAFGYTSAQTVSLTAATQEGAQHPTYELKMAGRGEVVLTDLRVATARVRIHAGAKLRYLLRGPQNVMLEVQGRTKDMLLAIPAGSYAIEQRGPDGRATGKLEIRAGETRSLPALVPSRYEMARAKGGPKPGIVFLGGGVGVLALAGAGPLPSVTAGLREELGPVGVRLKLDGMHGAVTDARLRYDLSWLSVQGAALWPANTHQILVEVGPQAGYAYIQQRLANQKVFTSGAWLAGVTAFVTAPLGPVLVGLDLSVSAMGLTLNNEAKVRATGAAGLLILYGF